MITPWHTGIPHSEDPCWICRYLSFSLVWASIPISIRAANWTVCAQANTDFHRYEHILREYSSQHLASHEEFWTNGRTDCVHTRLPPIKSRTYKSCGCACGCATCWELVSWSSILPLILRRTQKSLAAQLNWPSPPGTWQSSLSQKHPPAHLYMMIIYSH
jgi:hypothetical protein